MGVAFQDYHIAGDSFHDDNDPDEKKLSRESDEDLARAVSLLNESAAEFRANAERLTQLYHLAVNSLNEFSALRMNVSADRPDNQ